MKNFILATAGHVDHGKSSLVEALTGTNPHRLPEEKARGITIEGQTLARNSRVPQDQRFNPAQSIELASISSQPLSEIVKRTNKESVNVNAELILRTLGRERGEMAALPEAVGKERGDDEAGLGVMRVWLARADVPMRGAEPLLIERRLARRRQPDQDHAFHAE